MFDFSAFEGGFHVTEFREHFWTVKELITKNPDPEIHSAVFSYKRGSNKLLDEIGPLSSLAEYLLEHDLIPSEATVHWLSGNGPFDGEIRFDGSTLHIEVCKPLKGEERMLQGKQILARGCAPVEDINGRTWSEGLPDVIMEAIEKKAQRAYETKPNDISVLLIYIAVEQIHLDQLLHQKVFAGKTLEEFIAEKCIPADRVILMTYNWDGTESRTVCLNH